LGRTWEKIVLSLRLEKLIKTVWTDGGLILRDLDWPYDIDDALDSGERQVDDLIGVCAYGLVKKPSNSGGRFG
jgi:hypothetical protein